MVVYVLLGTKVHREALQCVPSLWTRWKRRSMGDTVRSTEKLSSGTRTTIQSQSLGLEW